MEPIQGRAGLRAATTFLGDLKALCEHHALLICDEIYTGFGRTGEWLACDHQNFIRPYLLGKALTNGFPLSACVGRATVMDRAWPASEGENPHQHLPRASGRRDGAGANQRSERKKSPHP